MSTRKPTNLIEEVEALDDEPMLVEEQIVVNDEFKNARVKGTWTMYWGRDIYEFEDGKRYRLPAELFIYLKDNGNIYDTL
jgi:hypothetical protein